jgi:hypothetical protein
MGGRRITAPAALPRVAPLARALVVITAISFGRVVQRNRERISATNQTQ